MVLRNVMLATSFDSFPLPLVLFKCSNFGIQQGFKHPSALYKKDLPDLERMATKFKKGEDLISTIWLRYLGSEIHIWFKDEDN